MKGSKSDLSVQAVIYMSILAFQFGSQPVLTKLFVSPSVCKTSIVIAQEICKFVISFLMLFANGSWPKVVSGWNISTWLNIAGIPAALYCVQNMAILLAYQNLNPFTFNVLNQTKTLSAAAMCYVIIGRKQSKIQIFALCFLFLSALVIEKIISIEHLSQGNSDVSDSDKYELSMIDTRHFTHGVLPVLLASFISGLAGALSQKNLQTSEGSGNKGGRNSYLFTMELCAASLIFLIASLFSSNDGMIIARDGFFYQWTPQTLIPILTNSAGGIIVGLVTKYAGSVRKGFSLIFGLMLSGLLQTLIDPANQSASISRDQVLGGLLASISLYLHSSHPYNARLSDSNLEVRVNDAPKQKYRKVRKED